MYSRRSSLGIDDLHQLRDTLVECVTLHLRRVLHADGCVREHAALPVALGAGQRVVIGRDLVPAHIQRRQVIAFIAESQVGRPLEEQRPARDPQPKFFGLVRMQRQRVGLLGVAAEETRLGLADLHHAKECSVGQQLDEIVR
ncbi:MAG: hypothetical protein ACYC28_15060 [Longimicrobiales bacterium]